MAPATVAPSQSAVCFWEDDKVQLRWPEWAGGANKPSLIESQHNFARKGAVEFRVTGLVRRAAPDEPVEGVGGQSISAVTTSSPET